MTLLKFLLADAVIDLLIIAILYRFFMGALAERIIALKEVPKANLQAEDYEDTDDSVWEEGWVPVLIVFVLLCIVPTVHAQSVGGSVGSAPMSSTFEVQGHAQEAHYAPLDVNRDLLAPSSYISVQGDGTMCQLPVPATTPLGTAARKNRISPLPYTAGKHVETYVP